MGVASLAPLGVPAVTHAAVIAPRHATSCLVPVSIAIQSTAQALGIISMTWFAAIHAPVRVNVGKMACAINNVVEVPPAQ